MMCSRPNYVWPKNKIITVPCGKCLACLSNRRVDWAFRLQQEWKRSRAASFITLTYDRDHLAKCDYELSKRDLQLFFKKLRKHEKTNRLRYYAVGEYGSKTLRPHYHIILFNSVSSEPILRKIWAKGLTHMGKVSAASISYCLKYLVQPELAIKGKQKPFCLMSRAYGLGAHYLSDAMVDWHRSADRNFTMVNGIQGRLPRFYKDKIWYKDHDRQRVGDNSKWFAIKRTRLELRDYVRIFGVFKAKPQRERDRDLVLKRLKIKVAFTQTI